MAKGLCFALASVMAASPSSAQPRPPGDGPAPPAEISKTFTVADDLEIELILSEPEITQPVFLNFDERGRMWVVEFRQYPQPAGLKAVSHDDFWRAVYDKVPSPPPRHFPGSDRISIHEDTDGDGSFDSHKVFLEGLSIATAVERGRGGVWVLNPPYLLFYPDQDGDDVPDSDPVVHLAGFGLEDTHSVANSLRWGPDGWLYGAQGSTVTGHMMRPGLDAAPFLRTIGQGIWRYHPEARRFEFFAEGGGNTFGVEIDSKGRIFSGHNGGDTRGFHYVQGGYLRKGFEKHGPLSNPYAFGFYEPMTHHRVERFTHNFVIYEGNALSAPYAGKLLGIEPLQGRMVMSAMTPEGSTFRTSDLSRPLTSRDPWFRPVDIKVGPDGAVYLCDWSDNQIAHYRAADGAMEKGHGRIFRLKGKGAPAGKRFDLHAFASSALCDLLWHPNKWFRQTAHRLLADQRDSTVGAALAERLFASHDQAALEALWALRACGALSEERLRKALDHRDPHVRLWAVRLACDEESVSPVVAERLVQLARAEPHPEVRLQLAASARRLPAQDGLAIIRELAMRDEDAADSRQPLMIWWAIEAKAADAQGQVVALFNESPLWDRPLVRDHLLHRVMRRFAQSGTGADLLVCAQLFDLAPSPEHSRRLLAGFEEAFAGRTLAGLPEELIRAMARHGVGSRALAVRMGDSEAQAEALSTIRDSRARLETRLGLIQMLGEVDVPGAAAALMAAAEEASDERVRQAAFTALRRYDEPAIGMLALRLIPRLGGQSRTSAHALLVSRASWAQEFLKAVLAGTLPAGTATPEMIQQLRLHESAELNALLSKLEPAGSLPPAAQMDDAVRRTVSILRSGTGDPYRGRELFQTRCAACHTLFSQGGRIGPDLTSFQRDDLASMALHVVHPNAEIREGYENFTARTRDGRLLAGFLAEQNDKVLTLRGLDGQDTKVARDAVAQLQPAGVSLMPEGLLEGLDEQQTRDLFAYLGMTQPLVLKRLKK